MKFSALPLAAQIKHNCIAFARRQNAMRYRYIAHTKLIDKSRCGGCGRERCGMGLGLRELVESRFQLGSKLSA